MSHFQALVWDLGETIPTATKISSNHVGTPSALLHNSQHDEEVDRLL
jgi:hypothetical protein